MCGYFGASVNDGWINKILFFDAIKQRIAESRLTVFAAECAISIKKKAPFIFTGIGKIGIFVVKFLEIVFWGGGKPEFIANKVFKYRPRITADGTVCFIGYDKIEIRWGKKSLVFIIEQKGLNCAYNDFGANPIIPIFLIDYGLIVIG